MVILTFVVLILFWNIKIYLHYLNTESEMAQVVNPSLTENKNVFILHEQHHGCWCPVDKKSLDISCRSIDLVILEYF